MGHLIRPGDQRRSPEQIMENNPNRLTHHGFPGVIYIKMKLHNCNQNEHGVIVIEYNIIKV